MCIKENILCQIRIILVESKERTSIPRGMWTLISNCIQLLRTSKAIQIKIQSLIKYDLLYKLQEAHWTALPVTIFVTKKISAKRHYGH